MSAKGIYLFLLALMFTMASCGGNGSKEENRMGIENETTHSQFLKIDKRNGYSIAEITDPWDTTKLMATYVFVPSDSELPDSLPKGIVVRTPVKSLIVYSSVTGSALEELGSEQVIKGVADAGFFKMPHVVEGLEDGSVVNIGLPSSPSKEKIIALNPDGILLNIYDGMDVKGIENLKAPVLRMVDNMEPTPLGRAEWIKFLGLLTGKEQMADSIFNSVCESYGKLKNHVSGIDKKPKILTETIYEGVWYVPGGGSYQARLIEDAAGDYFRKDDNSQGSLNMSFEQVLDKGNDADIWLIKLYDKELTGKYLMEMDSRYGYFAPVKKKGVYYSNTAKSTLFEDFPFHPEKLLHDYAVIFHPEKFPGDSLTYFKKMGE